MNNRVDIAKKFAKTIKSSKISKIILFGSVARGTDYEDSDIDILIVSKNPEEIEEEINDEVVNIILNDEEYISAQIMNEKYYNTHLEYPFLINVLKDGILLG